MMKKLKNSISTKEFDRRFNANEDVTDHLDISKVKINKHFHRINIDFPETFIRKIDEEANKIGVARTALIKIWIAERLQAM
ncbi:MAG: CopG family antitoxin [Elusimicrobiota bacterium]